MYRSQGSRHRRKSFNISPGWEPPKEGSLYPPKPWSEINAGPPERVKQWLEPDNAPEVEPPTPTPDSELQKPGKPELEAEPPEECPCELD